MKNELNKEWDILIKIFFGGREVKRFFGVPRNAECFRGFFYSSDLNILQGGGHGMLAPDEED